jgi:hypothetical protein
MAAFWRLRENGLKAVKIPASNDAGFFMRHITGDSRQQATLLPDTLDCPRVDGSLAVYRVCNGYLPVAFMTIGEF